MYSKLKRKQIAFTCVKFILVIALLSLSLPSILHADPGQPDPETSAVRGALQSKQQRAKQVRATGRQVFTSGDIEIATSLVHASIYGLENVVRILVQAGCDVDYCDTKGRAPLTTAVYNGHAEIVLMLLQAGANTESRSDNGATPLMIAAQMNEKEAAEMLVAEGADVNAWDYTGLSPLIWAVVSGSVDIVNLLIENGANINEFDAVGWMALDYAIHLQDQAMIPILSDATLACMGVSFSGGSGDSINNPVVICGDLSMENCARAEFLWLLRNCPEWRFLECVKLIGKEIGHIDRVRCEASDGERWIYFDIGNVVAGNKPAPRRSSSGEG